MGTLDCENLFAHNGESIEKVIDGVFTNGTA